jgi:hypothetical protein
MQATAPSLQDCVCFSRPLAKQRKGSRLLSPQIPQRITGQGAGDHLLAKRAWLHTENGFCSNPSDVIGSGRL